MSNALAFPLKAQLSSMNARTRELLRYHFRHHRSGGFALAEDADTPDVVIIDYDHPGTREKIEAGHWADGPAVMVLAYGEPPVDQAVVVCKPLDRARLDAAARQLVHESRPATDMQEQAHNAAIGDHFEGSSASSTKPSSGSPPESSSAASAVMSSGSPSAAHQTRQAEKQHGPVGLRHGATAQDSARHDAKVLKLCGHQRTIDQLSIRHDVHHRFDPEQYFNAFMRRELEAAERSIRALRFTVSGIDILVMPLLNKLYMTESLTRSDNVERLFRRLDPAEIDTASYRNAELGQLLKRLEGKARYAYSIEAFAWIGSLFAARGRLPFGIDVDHPWRLDRWPNLTRLELTPQCLEIAALWSADALSIRQMIRQLSGEARFVTTFFNGAAALELISSTQKRHAPA